MKAGAPPPLEVVHREEISTKGNNDPTYREQIQTLFFLTLLKSKKGLLGEVNE